MEQEGIAELLEKYFQAETTVEEERLLAEYFRRPVVVQEWEPYRELFGYYESGREPVLGEDFDDKMLERIRSGEARDAGSLSDAGISGEARGAETLDDAGFSGGAGGAGILRGAGRAELFGNAGDPGGRVVAMARFERRKVRSGWWAAAAVILLSVGWLLGPGRGSEHAVAYEDGIVRAGTTAARDARYAIKDTYDDPEQALAAIRKALQKVSSHINQGKRITKKEMRRMNESWETAVDN